jgi:hypothetical protein
MKRAPRPSAGPWRRADDAQRGFWVVGRSAPFEAAAVPAALDDTTFWRGRLYDGAIPALVKPKTQGNNQLGTAISKRPRRLAGDACPDNDRVTVAPEITLMVSVDNELAGFVK